MQPSLVINFIIVVIVIVVFFFQKKKKIKRHCKWMTKIQMLDAFVKIER